MQKKSKLSNKAVFALVLLLISGICTLVSALTVHQESKGSVIALFLLNAAIVGIYCLLEKASAYRNIIQRIYDRLNRYIAFRFIFFILLGVIMPSVFNEIPTGDRSILIRLTVVVMVLPTIFVWYALFIDKEPVKEYA